MAIEEWRENAIMGEARAVVWSGVGKALQYAKAKVMISINRGNASGKNPSLPGEPPKKVSALLFSSIATEQEREGDVIIGRYGTNVIYARRLELGFAGVDKRGRLINQAPRPFLRPILTKFSRQIARLVAGG